MTQAPPPLLAQRGMRRSRSNTAQLDSTCVAYALPAETVLRQQEVSCAYGLAEQEAALRLKRYGPNTLLAHAERTSVSILADQLKSPVVWLLSAAAAVAALFGQWTEATAILLVLPSIPLSGF
jgi:magnesium-transporting ATPase (P-type)